MKPRKVLCAVTSTSIKIFGMKRRKRGHEVRIRSSVNEETGILKRSSRLRESAESESTVIQYAVCLMKISNYGHTLIRSDERRDADKWFEFVKMLGCKIPRIARSKILAS